MKPKFLPVLEMCIENGLAYGYRRAFKHNDNPTEEEMTDQIKQSIMHELYEWFDMENINEWVHARLLGSHRDWLWWCEDPEDPFFLVRGMGGIW